MAGGATKVSLIEAQPNYQGFGACDQHGRQYTRPPAENEPRGPPPTPCSAGGSPPSGARTTPRHDLPGELTDAVSEPRRNRLRPCGRELRDEDVRGPAALSRTEQRAVPGPPVVAHHPLHPAPAQ
ncbi:CPCC family cysteine-rich protein [Streptomyces sp. NPDC090119]|uniref:CPCC family cysteine-rich protein n=1 Tax=Streptomyces sp. NPDC090119 TaxID=3365951 RepID=UPI00382B21A5